MSTVNTPSEKVVSKDSIAICTESFGQPRHPAMVLIMGASASMVWWDREFCEKLAEKGFYVIRFDNRDVGASTTYPPGEPPYSVMDMADDILTVMDAYHIGQAHLVGMSLGGMLSQLVAIQHPERVLSMTAIASGVWDDLPDLPQVDQKILDYHASAATLDWSNEQDVVHYLVGGWRLLNGSRHPFDESGAIRLAETEVKRANNLLSMFNHAYLKGGEALSGRSVEITAPTLIIHGTEDIVLPYVHAEVMHRTIPGSRLITIEGGGHEIHRQDWEMIISAIAEHAGGG